MNEQDLSGMRAAAHTDITEKEFKFLCALHDPEKLKEIVNVLRFYRALPLPRAEHFDKQEEVDTLPA